MKPSLSIAALFFLLLSLSIHSCKPEKVKPTEPIQEGSKFDRIKGDYKVYDTLGSYLYELKIEHRYGKNSQGYIKDSFVFVNLDNQFNLKYFQSSANNLNWPKDYLDLGSYDPIFDAENRKIAFWGYQTALINDTIVLEFTKDNIRYYLTQMVPYYYQKCKHIAVKQH